MEYIILFIAFFIVFFLSGAFFSSWFYRNRIRMLEDENTELRRVIANPELITVRNRKSSSRDYPKLGGYQPKEPISPLEPPPRHPSGGN